MKRISFYLLMVLMFVFFLPSLTRADYMGPTLEINETNFPDAAFRAFLIEELKPSILYEEDKYYYMIPDEPIYLSVTGENSIVDMTGIKLLNVKYLTVTDCASLQSLDLSESTVLKELTVRNCASIRSIDVINCRALQMTEAEGNGALKTLNVSGCSTMIILRCDNNLLAGMNLTGCSSLQYLRCRKNQLAALDLSDCVNMKELLCNYNLLTELIVRNMPELTLLQCIGNHLSHMNASNCPSLTNVYCFDNMLETMDLKNCTSLKVLDCSNNQLHEVDLSGLSRLDNLYISRNKLETLDISSCPVLCSYVNDRADTRNQNQSKSIVFYKVGPTGESWLTYDLNTALVYDKGIIPAGGPVEIQKQENTITAPGKSVYAGKSVSLGASAKTVLSYTSSNKKIAAVSSTGLVKGIAPGTATITIQAKETDKYLSAVKKVKVIVYAAKGKTYTVGNYKYKISNAASGGKGTVTLLKPVKTTFKTVIVPAVVKIGSTNYKVTAIGSKAFYQNRMLTKAVIGINVKTIGTYAFAGDSKLKTIEVKSKVLAKAGYRSLYNIYRKAVIKVPASKKTAYRKLLVNTKMPSGATMKVG